MTKTTNNSFSVKALVAKYRNFVMENTPYTDKREGDIVFSMCDPNASSADFQLISQVYKDVLGDKADQKVLDIMSEYINCFCKDALTDDEYAFLCENFPEFIDYEFINKKSWVYGSVMTAGTQDIVLPPVIDLSSVAGVPAETLKFLSTHCAISKDETLFVSGDKCGDIKSLFAINDDALHCNSKEESWALNTIRFCMRSTGALLAKGIPAEHTQDVVVFFDYDKQLSGFGKILCDLHGNGSDKKVLLADAFKMLKSDGRMYLDIARTQLKKGSGIYSDIQKFVSEKLVKSVSTYKSHNGQYRCLLVIDKRGAEKITMKAEMLEKSVDVSYDAVDMDMLWPGYYYNKRQSNTIPLSELVEMCGPEAESSEKGTDVDHFVLPQSLETGFMDSRLSEADLYMAEKAMKRLRVEKTDEVNKEDFRYTDENFDRMGIEQIKMMRKMTPCSHPCVVLSSSFRVGYVPDVPADGLCVSPLLYCLKPKHGVSAQYIAALLCDEDINLQIRRTCEDVFSSHDLGYVLDKIYVPDYTPIERERFVASVAMSAYDNLKKEKEQDLTNYSNGIRLRKHALSQSLSSVSSLFDTLNTLRKRNFGTLDDTDVVSVKGFTVADIFERLEKWLPEVMETVDHLADIDYSFGKIESINPETFIEGYISSHDNEWMNFSASVNWIRGNNIAREDKKMNGVVLLKKGDPISSFNFPKDALYRILDNIVSNAKEYAFTDEGREDYDLHFSWRMNGTDLVIEIANNGTPIPEDRDVRSLLEYGVSSNLHSRGHNGIGCHEIKGIMNRYNGDFEIVSKPQDKYTVRYLLVFKSTNTLYTL